MNINDCLRQEHLMYVADHCDDKTIFTVLDLVCKTWNEVINDDLYWNQKFKREYPNVPLKNHEVRTDSMKTTYFLFKYLPKNFHPMGGPANRVVSKFKKRDCT